jgi:hypothetical protein
MFAVGFLIYEILNDWRIKDHSYKDVLGYLYGIGAGAVILYLMGV